jgi:hypothetical protein
MVVLLGGMDALLNSLPPTEQTKTARTIMAETEAWIAEIQREIHSPLLPTPRQRRLMMYG